jgi:hypothetical protein
MPADRDDPARGTGPSFTGINDEARGLVDRLGMQRPRVAQAAQKPRQKKPTPRPRLTIVGVHSGLAEHQRDAVTKLVIAALKTTTDDAKEPGVKAGVVVTFVEGLKGSEAMRRRGDIVVYVVSGVGNDDKRAATVRDILKERGWDADKRNATKGQDRLAEDVSRLSGLLRDVNLHDPRTSVVVVDISAIPSKPTSSNLTAVAGTVIHEAIGHGAGLKDAGKQGIMSVTTPTEAKLSDIVFDKSVHDTVNEYLLQRALDPQWEYR